MLKHITIHQRLLCGYALILGIAVVGTTKGLIIGNQQQRQALRVQQTAVDEHTLLKDLQVSILINRPAKQLSPHLNDAEQFQQEGQAFLRRIQKVQMILAEYYAFHQPDSYDEVLEHLLLTETALPDDDDANEATLLDDAHHARVAFLKDAEVSVEQFYRRTSSFIHTVNALGYASETLEIAQQEVIKFAQSDEFREYVELSDQLTPLIAEIEVQKQAAELVLHRAEQLRTFIVIGSLLVSTAIAAIVGFYTSRAIAQPLQTVTRIAKRVTQNNDFNLQVPVQRNDEVGSLAIVLNQLIQQVKNLLSQLERNNTDLEDAFKQLQRQQIHLVQAEKMSSLGQLVAGVAHEINNPVNFIHGNLMHVQEYTHDLMQLIATYQQQYPDANDVIQTAIEDSDLEFIQGDLPKILDSMNIGTKRIREIVLSLRNFSRMDEAELKPADLHEGLNNTLLLLKHRIKATAYRPEVQIIRNYGDIPPVECYAGLLNQVFMNILVNALDALDEKAKQQTSEVKGEYVGKLRLETSIVRGKQGGGASVNIAIADNGIGMVAATQQRIFDPFFTTKPVGKGTGMGLSLCYQIVSDRHDGHLGCDSTMGQGTTFNIRIPLCPTLSPQDPIEPKAEYSTDLSAPPLTATI